MSDNECEEEQQQQFDIDSWRYDPPPNVQGSFYFEQDRLLFDSTFDSGNLMDVERVGLHNYNLYLAPDCAKTPKQTTNKQWFHFSISGGLKGQTVTLNIVNIPCCKMYSFPGYAPTVAVMPTRPTYNRLNTKIHIKKLDPISPTCSSAMGTPSSSCAPTSVLTFDMPGAATTGSAVNSPATPEVKKKAMTMCNLTFDYTFEADSFLKDDDSGSSFHPNRNPSNYSSTVFMSQAHPYSYAKLQRYLSNWDIQVNGPAPCTALDSRTPAIEGNPGLNAAGIYYHRELLTYSLDRNRCDVITISGTNGLAALPADGSILPTDEAFYEPMLDTHIPVPPHLAGGLSHDGVGHVQEAEGLKYCTKTGRARVFPKKKYVILSARVHPGEIPASHILHGAIEFLLNKADPRAKELRKNCVFVIVPMINPDGVVRGHSRADTTGQNLNRTYAKPCSRRHPTTFALRKLLFQLEGTGRLAAYIDIHAHANKRGMFFYGNAMTALNQIQNLLYAKLVSLNTPFFEFQSCNFSEQNMFAVGKNGEGKDSSSRVVLFKERGFIHSYTLESNYVCGTTLNDVKGLGPQFPGEESGTLEGTPSPKYTLNIFHDVGRALAVSVADLLQVNPASRINVSSFHNLRGVALWIQRALIVDAWEQVRRQQILQSGQSLSRDRDKGQPSFSTMAAAQFPDVITTRPSKTFPPTTVKDLSAAAKSAPPAEEDSKPASGNSFCRKGSNLSSKAGPPPSSRRPSELQTNAPGITNRRPSAAGGGATAARAAKVPSLHIAAAPRTQKRTSSVTGSPHKRL